MKKTILILTSVLMLFSCYQKPGEYDETVTRGDIKIGVDESFKLLIDTQISTFCSEYTYAKITPQYKPEYDIINDLIIDSVQSIVTAKKLTDNQIKFLEGKSIIPKTTTIAVDAVAFIVNRENNDSLIQINSLKEIFTGTKKDWKEINKNNKNGAIEVVFDNNKSSNARYLLERLNLKEFQKNCYTAFTNDEVIKYVEKNKNAIGVISVNWISENTDSISNNFLKRIRVVGLTSEQDPEGNYYYKPYAAYIADKSYPFTREIYMINCESFRGLGTGFISYVSGEKGQRIVLKAGLVPATMPVRMVEINKK